ncbi:MAG: hypothetical protein ACRENE_02440 [Polyangiaceae bacterium]
MTTKRTVRALGRTLALASLFSAAACSSVRARTASGDHPIEAGDDGAPTYAPTYHAVYTEILSQSCFLGFCHSGQESDYLLLDTEADGYRSLVGTPAQGPMCSGTGLERVAPGHPDESLILFKLTNPPCGSRMPSGRVPLTTRQIDQIGQWIACGALSGESPCPADAGTFAFDGGFFRWAGDSGTQ